LEINIPDQFSKKIIWSYRLRIFQRRNMWMQR